MATLVLSSVGSALGGPVGGAIGALIGQSIDRQLLGPSTRGPRVGDLSVQSSSYGTQIPRIYGTMRVAGTVIWATDLVESTQMTGAKGQPDATYSYSVSLAVALSSRPVVAIKRIWADGKLLRGENGDFKVGTTFRFYDGSADQDVDPLIGSIEGIGNTPAYRGLALAVFEDLELAPYGNRIPLLTFEIVADEEQPTIGDIFGDAPNLLVSTTAPQEVAGYAAYGETIKAAIEPLINCFGVDLFDDGSTVRDPVQMSAQPIGDDEFGNSADNERVPRVQRERTPARSIPATLRLGYYDPRRDFQTGEARANSGDRSGTEEQLDLPAALEANDAKSLAQQILARDWAKRDRVRLSLPPRYLSLEPGARLDLPLTPAQWSVEQTTINGMAVEVDLRPDSPSSALLVADAGRIIGNKDEVAGALTIALLDLPPLSPTSPTLLLAASSPTPGWAPSRVELRVVGQSLALRTAPRKSLLGNAQTILAAGDPSEIDAVNSFDVLLIDADQWMTACDDQALASGANLALLGEELLQFGEVTPLGNGRFRLSRLLRGRAGTEAAIATHTTGEVFCLIEPGSLQSVPLPVTSIGTEVTAQVPGGDSFSLTVSPRASAIASPAGGATIDDEARTAIDQILTTMRQHKLIDS